MRNATFNAKTLDKTLMGGALALAVIVPLQAQVLGGPVISTMGQVGGPIRGMGNLSAPDINPPSVTPGAKLPDQAVSKGAAGTAHATQSARLAKQASGSAATHALNGLAIAKGVADANAVSGLATGAGIGGSQGSAALKGATRVGSSVASSTDATGTRDTAAAATGDLTRQARSGVSAAGSRVRGTVSRTQHTAWKMSSSVVGPLLAARDTTAAGVHSVNSAAAAQASGSASNTSSAAAASSDGKSGHSNGGSPRKPGLLSPLNNSMSGKAKTVDTSGSGSGSTSGNEDTRAGGASSDTNGSAHANARAGASGLARDGILASVRADGGASSAANTRTH
jgi:hypothetical protein